MNATEASKLICDALEKCVQRVCESQLDSNVRCDIPAEARETTRSIIQRAINDALASPPGVTPPIVMHWLETRFREAIKRDKPIALALDVMLQARKAGENPLQIMRLAVATAVMDVAGIDANVTNAGRN